MVHGIVGSGVEIPMAVGLKINPYFLCRVDSNPFLLYHRCPFQTIVVCQADFRNRYGDFRHTIWYNGERFVKIRIWIFHVAKTCMFSCNKQHDRVQRIVCVIKSEPKLPSRIGLHLCGNFPAREQATEQRGEYVAELFHKLDIVIPLFSQLGFPNHVLCTCRMCDKP